MSSFKTQLLLLVSGIILAFIVIIFLIFKGVDETRQDLLDINKNYLAQITLKLDLTLWEDSFSSILEKNFFAKQTRSKKIGFLNVYFSKLLEGEVSDFPGVDFGYYDKGLKAIVGCTPPLDFPLNDMERDRNNGWRASEKKLKAETISELSEEAIKENQVVFVSRKLDKKYFLFYIFPLERNDELIGTSWALMEFRDFYESFRVNLEISLIFVVVALFAALSVGNNLRKGVSHIREGLRILEFDLAHRFRTERGEIGEITATINELASTLSKVKSYTELILESTSEGVIALDKDGKVAFFNRAAASLLNISYEKVVGKDFSHIFPDKESVIRKSFKDAMEGRDREILKVNYQVPGGHELPIGINTFSLETEGRKGVVMILRDLSETERMERKLRQSDKLAALGKLVAGVAHEIRNPIAAIRANVQLWEKRLDKAKPSREALHMVIDEVDRLNDIVNKWLIFSRGKKEAGENCSINSIIEKTLELIKIEIESKNIKFSFEGEEDLPPVCVNAGEVEQVIINIIRNALDVLSEGGSLLIKTSYDEDKKEVKAEFTDTGPGIPLEIQGKVFDPFFTTKEDGTGLGLAICYDIITAQHGTIDFETALGKGTTFYITFPAAEDRIVDN